MTAIQELPNQASQAIQARESLGQQELLGQEELQGEDLKGAFLALLQGLVGMSGQVPATANTIPELPKAAEAPVESREHVVDKDIKSKEQIVLEPRTHIAPEAQQREQTMSSQEVTKKSQAVVSEGTQPVEGVQEEVKTEVKTEVAKDVAQQTQSANSTVAKVVQEVQKEVVSQRVPLQEAVQESAERIKKSSAQGQTQAEVPRAQEGSTRVTGLLPQQGEASYNTDVPLVDQIEVESVSKNNLLNKKQGTEFQRFEVPTADEHYAKQSVGSLLSKMSQAPAPVKTDSEIVQPQSAKEITAADLGLQYAYSQLMMGVGAGQESSGAMKQLTLGQSVEQTIGINDKSSQSKAQEKASRSSELVQRANQQQEFVTAVKEALERAAVGRTNNEISVKVNPPHLGEVRVKVRHNDDGVHAKITSENKDIEHVLRTKSSELTLVLQALGFKTDEIQVTIGNDFERSALLHEQPGGDDAQSQQADAQDKEGKGNKTADQKGELSGEGLEGSVDNVEDEAGWVA